MKPDAVQQMAAHAGVPLEDDRAETVSETWLAFIAPDLALVDTDDVGSEPPAMTFTVLPSKNLGV
jgi:hypothetical protein